MLFSVFNWSSTSCPHIFLSSKQAGQIVHLLFKKKNIWDFIFKYPVISLKCCLIKVKESDRLLEDKKICRIL